MTGRVRRNARGQFVTSGNPLGRPKKRRRFFTSDQVTADVLSICEEPVTVTQNGQKMTMPASEVILRRLTEKAVVGDTRAILKVIEMRERHAEVRTRNMAGHAESAQQIIDGYRSCKEDMPIDSRILVADIFRIAQEGQFTARSPDLRVAIPDPLAKEESGQERKARLKALEEKLLRDFPDEEGLG